MRDELFSRTRGSNTRISQGANENLVIREGDDSDYDRVVRILYGAIDIEPLPNTLIELWTASGNRFVFKTGDRDTIDKHER